MSMAKGMGAANKQQTVERNGIGDQVRHVIERANAQSRRRVFLASVIAAVFCAFFVLYGTLDAWDQVIFIRVQRFAALFIVAIALAIATVVFQVVTRNRILSPGVMGFDEMFRLVVTATVFLFGAQLVNQIPSVGLFAINTTAMSVMAVGLFLALLKRGRNSIHLLVLAGIVLGIFMRSLTTMMALVIDPGEFFSVQNRTIASFAATDLTALWVTGVTTLVCLVIIFRRRHRWDILYLGQDIALTLGLEYRREIKVALAVAAVLVACSTALVGPFMFFGLLVVNIAVFYLRSSKLSYLLPTAMAVGIIVLVGGQSILENVFHRALILPVVIELVGGTMLLVMIIRGAKK